MSKSEWVENKGQRRDIEMRKERERKTVSQIHTGRERAFSESAVF